MNQPASAPSETRRFPLAPALAALLAGAAAFLVGALPIAAAGPDAALLAHESTVDDDDMGSRAPAAIYAHESTVDDDDMG